MPNDERVDGNKSYGFSNKSVWSVRPGINKIAFDTVSGNSNQALQIFIDAQGLGLVDLENLVIPMIHLVMIMDLLNLIFLINL